MFCARTYEALCASAPDGRMPADARPGPAGGSLARRRGQALVEFALLVTILVFLVVGVVDFSRIFYYDVVLSSAANEGARAVASGASNTTAETITRNSAGVLGPSLGFSAATDIQPNEAGRGSDDNITNAVWTSVQVRYTFQPITPLVGQWLGSNVTIQRKVSQQLRTPCCY
jgi:Flp pilus assembly protein TadG